MTDPYRQFSVRLIEHIGAVIFWQQRGCAVTGTLEQCERAYRSAQTQNLLAGRAAFRHRPRARPARSRR
ncbi:hypothetical protein ACKUVQ_06335 [Mycobacterium seoulense]|uniref:hypothetical protein n=1 Tax=Mycobacterium seoulense TaxID=386911 RepID=UPI003CEA02F9